MTMLQLAVPAFECLKNSTLMMKTSKKIGLSVWQAIIGDKNSRFDLQDSFLFYDNGLCIPKSSIILRLITEIHGNGLGRHFGRDKTIMQIEARYY